MANNSSAENSVSEHSGSVDMDVSLDQVSNLFDEFFSTKIVPILQLFYAKESVKIVYNFSVLGFFMDLKEAESPIVSDPKPKSLFVLYKELNSKKTKIESRVSERDIQTAALTSENISKSSFSSKSLLQYVSLFLLCKNRKSNVAEVLVDTLCFRREFIDSNASLIEETKEFFLESKNALQNDQKTSRKRKRDASDSDEAPVTKKQKVSEVSERRERLDAMAAARRGTIKETPVSFEEQEEDEVPSGNEVSLCDLDYGVDDTGRRTARIIHENDTEPLVHLEEIEKLGDKLSVLEKFQSEGEEASFAQKATKIALQVLQQFSKFGVYLQIRKKSTKFELVGIGNMYTESHLALAPHENIDIMVACGKNPRASPVVRKLVSKQEEEAECVLSAATNNLLSAAQIKRLKSAVFAKSLYLQIMKGRDKLEIDSDKAANLAFSPEILQELFRSDDKNKFLKEKMTSETSVNEFLEKVLEKAHGACKVEQEIVAAKKLRLFAVGWILNEKQTDFRAQLTAKLTNKKTIDNEAKAPDSKKTAEEIATEVSREIKPALNAALLEFFKDTVNNLKLKRVFSGHDSEILVEIARVTAANDVFRHWKNDLSKFYRICEKRPILLFSSLSYSFLVRHFVLPQEVDVAFKHLEQINFSPRFWTHPENCL